MTEGQKPIPLVNKPSMAIKKNGKNRLGRDSNHSRSTAHRSAVSSDRKCSPARVIVAVNGNAYSSLTVDRLKADRSLIVLQLEEGNVAAARMAGLEVATTPFVCFLDDDDEFLPGGIEVRLHSIRQDDDVLVTNGYLRDGSNERSLVSIPASEINEDPIGSFLQQNWLASPAGIFRRTAVSSNLFNIRNKYFEWTWLFFALHISGIRVRYIDERTYRKYEDHGLCTSRSAEYIAAQAPFLRSLMAFPLTNDQLCALRRKYQAALNTDSVAAMRAGDFKSAWVAHARCLAAGGWRYSAYTRHLINPRIILRKLADSRDPRFGAIVKEQAQVRADLFETLPLENPVDRN